MDLIGFLLVLLSILHECAIPTVLAERSSRRPGFLDGRRGEMDEDFAVIDADLSAVADDRDEDDNRTPGHRDIALASLQILVAAGQRTKQPTTERPGENLDLTRRPLPPCQNGGIRLLGSFCYCPQKFMGRYCEIYRYNSSCGRIPHRQWVYINCNSCFCIAGVLKCQPHPMPGCELEGKSTPQPEETEHDDEREDENHVVINYHNSAITRLPNVRILVALSTAAFLTSRLSIRERVR